MKYNTNEDQIHREYNDMLGHINSSESPYQTHNDSSTDRFKRITQKTSGKIDTYRVNDNLDKVLALNKNIKELSRDNSKKRYVLNNPHLQTFSLINKGQSSLRINTYTTRQNTNQNELKQRYQLRNGGVIPNQISLAGKKQYHVHPFYPKPNIKAARSVNRSFEDRPGDNFRLPLPNLERSIEKNRCLNPNADAMFDMVKAGSCEFEIINSYGSQKYPKTERKIINKLDANFGLAMKTDRNR